MINTVEELIAALQEGFNPTDRVSIVTGDEDVTEELGAFELHGRGGDYCEIFVPTPEFQARIEEEKPNG